MSSASAAQRQRLVRVIAGVTGVVAAGWALLFIGMAFVSTPWSEKTHGIASPIFGAAIFGIAAALLLLYALTDGSPDSRFRKASDPAFVAGVLFIELMGSYKLEVRALRILGVTSAVILGAGALSSYLIAGSGRMAKKNDGLSGRPNP